LTLEHIHRYQLDLTRRRLSWSSFNQVVCALRFFYREVLGKDWDVRRIPYQKTGRGCPRS
jgi:integrase/recombinase XerD